MTGHRAAIQPLQQLRATGRLRASGLGTGARRALQPLFDTGALAEQRSGGGWRIVVQNVAALEQFIEAQFPAGLDVVLSGLGRAQAVERLKNAKRGRNDAGEPLLIRAFSPVVASDAGSIVDLFAATRDAGVAALLLNDQHDWKLDARRVATVENIVPFLLFERKCSGFDAAIYTAGRMSNRLLDWLAASPFPVTHCGDYDPVGLQDYCRLQARCGERASLFVPAQLPVLMEKHGRPELIRDSVAILASLRQSEDATVRAVVALMDAHGKGLDQEILWAPSSIQDD